MNKSFLAASAATLLAGALALPALAQNVAIVNGKPVPKSRLEALEAQIKAQAARTGQPVPPDVEKQLREEVIAREIFMQEAQRRGLEASPDFRAKMDLARQSVLINELFADYQKKNVVSDADAKAEYTAQCQAAAVQEGVTAAKAQAHCSCGAKVIEDKFTQAEIDQLTNKQVEPPMALRQKLMKEVLVCKTQ